MDPWLRDRYAGVQRGDGASTEHRRAGTPSRRAQLDGDRLLDGLARERRRRRARRAVVVVVLVLAVLAAAYLLFGRAALDALS